VLCQLANICRAPGLRNTPTIVRANAQSRFDSAMASGYTSLAPCCHPKTPRPSPIAGRVRARSTPTGRAASLLDTQCIGPVFIYKACDLVGWMTLYPSTKSRWWMKKASSTLHSSGSPGCNPGAFLQAPDFPELHPGYKKCRSPGLSERHCRSRRGFFTAAPRHRTTSAISGVTRSSVIVDHAAPAAG
jgi:hypothetical protein